MTKEYIERVELIRFLDEMAANASILREVEWTEVLKEMSAHIKTADVVEVKHGWWEKDPTEIRGDGEIYDYRCSLCKGKAPEGSYGNRDVLTDYCPNCGAKMDGETE